MNLDDSIRLLRYAEKFEADFKLDGIFIAVLHEGKTTFIQTKIPERLRLAINLASSECMPEAFSVRVHDLPPQNVELPVEGHQSLKPQPEN